MNTLSSLPPPAFGTDFAVRSPAAAEAGRSWDLPATEGGALHVGAAGQARSIDDIERDFLAALCESPSA